MSQYPLVTPNSSFFTFLTVIFLRVFACDVLSLCNALPTTVYMDVSFPSLSFKWGISSSERLIYHPRYNSISLLPKSSLILSFSLHPAVSELFSFFGAYFFIYVYCLYLKHGAYISLGKWFYLSHSVLYHSLKECLAHITPCVNRPTNWHVLNLYSLIGSYWDTYMNSVM